MTRPSEKVLEASHRLEELRTDLADLVRDLREGKAGYKSVYDFRLEISRVLRSIQ